MKLEGYKKHRNPKNRIKREMKRSTQQEIHLRFFLKNTSHLNTYMQDPEKIENHREEDG
jgi:hypothetical protein